MKLTEESLQKTDPAAKRLLADRSQNARFDPASRNNLCRREHFCLRAGVRDVEQGQLLGKLADFGVRLFSDKMLEQRFVGVREVGKG